MNSRHSSSRRGRATASSSSSSSHTSNRGRGRGRGRSRASYRRSRHSESVTSRASSSITPRQPSAAPTDSSRAGSHDLSVRFLQSSSTPSLAITRRAPYVAPSTSRSDFYDAVNDEAVDEIIMAVDMKPRGTVGCAYYVAAEEKLYIMEDVELDGPDVIEALKMIIDPTAVLCSNKLDDVVLSNLDPERDSTSDGDSVAPSMLPALCSLRPVSEFSYDSARNRLVNLKIGHEDGPKITFVTPGDFTAEKDGDLGGTNLEDHQGQLLRLAGWIDVDSRLSVGCAGAVLAYIHRKRAASFLPGDAAAQTMHHISRIEMFTLSGSMFVNADTLLSLQIIQSESHPHSHNQGPTKVSSGSKEGFSVYGLFHSLARTPQGKFLLRQYFLRPSVNLEVINGRLDTISFLLRAENMDAMDELIKNLSKVKNMRTTMINLRKGVSGTGAGKKGVSNFIWAGIRLFVFHALRIKDCLQEVVGADRFPVLRKVMHCFLEAQLTEIGRSITEIIDFELSQEQGRNVVRSGVDPDLDELKRTYEGLENLLAQVDQHVALSIPQELDADINVVFFPQIGFLIAIPQDPGTGHGLYEGPEDEPWERMFTTEEFFYYKNENVLEMDSHFGDIHGRICDREIEIIHELAENILQFEELLTTASDVCAEIDCILALAQGAREYNLVRPQLTDSNVLDIRGGRHILQERVVPRFIPNDTLIAGGESVASVAQRDHTQDAIRHQDETMPSIVLVTGPNFSGKSVYLKQVAIIVFMSHIGSFVPAARADIGLTDKIMTRVATRESVSRNQSAFMIDLQQISIALNLATNRSLLIIDEFGKGTDSHDGAGLAAGVFNHLLQRGEECPKVLGATHFHEIFESGFLLAHDRLAFGHFEVRVDVGSRVIEDQVTYLYNYEQGRSNNSYGTVCAALNGIPSEVTNRAEQLILLTARGEDLVSACATLPESEVRDAEDAEDVARAFMKMEISDNAKQCLGNLLEV